METTPLTEDKVHDSGLTLMKRGRRLAACGALAVGAALVARAVSAHDVVLRSSGTADVVCDSAASWETVRYVLLPAFPHPHGCAITAYADLDNPGGDGADQLYHITISLDDPSPSLGAAGEVTVEPRDQPSVDDPNVWPVATTLGVSAEAGAPHRFYLLCRKNAAGNPDLTIRDSGLAVVCLQEP
jgi:hypothetical protein